MSQNIPKIFIEYGVNIDFNTLFPYSNMILLKIAMKMKFIVKLMTMSYGSATS